MPPPTPLPLLWCSAALLAGIFTAGQVGGSPWVWGGAAAGALTLLVLGRRFSIGWPAVRLPQVGLAPLVLLAAFLMGGARLRIANRPVEPGMLAWHNGQGPAAVVGVISAPPEKRDGGWMLVVSASGWAALGEDGPGDFQAARGRVSVRTGPGGAWHYGDRVELRGWLLTPPDGAEFSYRDYLSRRAIHSQMTFAGVRLLERGAGSPLLGALYGLRERGLALIQRIYPAPESALVAGILLGDESGLTESAQENFRRTGTVHIIAISGFNISLLAAIFTRQFSRWLGWLHGSLAAAAAVLLYTVLVGGGAAVVRAAVLGWVGLLGVAIGRRQVGANSLAFTAALMCLVQPLWLWDAAFQLSFTATMGLVLFAEPLEIGFRRLAGRFFAAPLVDRITPPVSDYFLVTLAAQAAALPVMALHFGAFSWLSILANPLVLPAQPALMQLGGLSLLAGLAFEPLGQVFAWAAWPFAALTLRVVELFGRVSHPSWIIGAFSPLLVILYYAGLLGLTVWRERVRSWAGSLLRPALLAGGIFSIAALAWQATLTAPDGRLRLALLDTGAAEAVRIESPGGRVLLVNGGPSGRELLSALDRRAGFFHPGLDGLIVTRSNSQALAGLSALVERDPPGWALWSGNPGASRDAQALSEALEAGRVAVQPLRSGTTLDLGGGATLRIVGAARSGACLEVAWANFRALIASGMPCPADLPASVLVLPTSGLKDAIPGSADLGRLRPQAILLGSQDPARLAELSGWPVVAPQRYGWVEVVTDGEQMWAEVGRR